MTEFEKMSAGKLYDTSEKELAKCGVRRIN